MNESVRNSRFLKAARLEPTDATPVWFMRQAGRYMPEYRALRAKTTMLGAIQDPALAAEITLQPIHAFDLDAAILFNDILTPLIGMGLELDFVEGKGPVIGNAIASLADIERLMTPSAAEAMPYTAQAIRLVTAELGAACRSSASWGRPSPSPATPWRAGAAATTRRPSG